MTNIKIIKIKSLNSIYLRYFIFQPILSIFHDFFIVTELLMCRRYSVIISSKDHHAIVIWRYRMIVEWRFFCQMTVIWRCKYNQNDVVITSYRHMTIIWSSFMTSLWPWRSSYDRHMTVIWRLCAARALYFIFHLSQLISPD